jgi:serpin B
MKPFRRKVLRIALLCLIASFPLLGSGPPLSKTIAIPEISDRINAFTLDLLKHYASGAEADRNTILSPQSIFHGLAISYVASDGETRKELARVLHFPADDQKLMDDLAGLRRQLAEAANRKKIDVSVANSLWLDTTYAEFRKDYVKKVEKAFAASLHSVNFQQSGRVSGEINKWVAEKTRGKIQRTVGPKDFESRSGPGVIDEPALVSVNAVYFKADWGSRFEKGATLDGPFHVDPNTTVNAPMMHQRSLLAYAADDDFKFLEIPYVDGQYSMYILLPNQVLGVKQLMARITAETIVRLKRASAAYLVDVLLPKFTLQGHYGITGTLTEMGVRSAFDRRQADFDKMIVKRMEAYRIYISEVYHDAWIEVHEEGTEAAAATSTTHFSIGCSASPRPMPVDFHADHPFLYAIVHNKNYSILFAGWITNPGGLRPQARPAGQ